MPLFVCDDCDHVENTATSQGGWYDHKINGEPARCCVCRGFDWHDRFPRVRWDGARDVLNQPSPSRPAAPPGS